MCNAKFYLESSYTADTNNKTEVVFHQKVNFLRLYSAINRFSAAPAISFGSISANCVEIRSHYLVTKDRPSTYYIFLARKRNDCSCCTRYSS